MVVRGRGRRRRASGDGELFLTLRAPALVLVVDDMVFVVRRDAAFTNESTLEL